MFRWSAFSGGNWIYEGDWGRDIVNKAGILNIEKILLEVENSKVYIYPNNGVIINRDSYINLGISKDGYCFRLYDEAFFELLEVAPFTTAEYDVSSKTNKVIDRHFLLKYKITHIKDKVTNKKQKLAAPIIKEFLIRCYKDNLIDIC